MTSVHEHKAQAGKPAIDRAMVLAAGLGTRMRPITDTLPKPLVPVAGKPLIDYALGALATAGVATAIVNVHHHAELLVAHLASVKTPRIVISDETGQLLDSGGGIVKALPLLGNTPFFVLNADTFWLDAEGPPDDALTRMRRAFDPSSMDILMLVAAPNEATGYDGACDFEMMSPGRLKRYGGTGQNPVIYAGALILHPRILKAMPSGPFSLNRCFDHAMQSDRLRAIRLNGHWLTVGTPDAIGAAEDAMRLWTKTRQRTA